MSTLFGGKKSSSTDNSYNQSYDYLKNQFGGTTGYAGTGAEMLSGLLGGDASGFNNFKNATGFSQLLQNGSQGITGNAAASGLLRSGGTGKALVNYGNQMQNQYANDYLSNAAGLSGLGLKAGELIGSAGNIRNATSKSSEKPGMGGFLGQIGAGVAASDRRLKDNIKKIGELADGLGVYNFTYKNDEDNVKWRGVMADEVAELRPWALGPVTDAGFATVNYDHIWEG